MRRRHARAVRLTGEVLAEEPPARTRRWLRTRFHQVRRRSARDADRLALIGVQQGEQVLAEVPEVDGDDALVDRHTHPGDRRPAGHHGPDSGGELVELGLGAFHLDGDDTVVGKELVDLVLALGGPGGERDGQPALVLPVDPQVLECRPPLGPGEHLIDRLLVADVDGFVTVEGRVGADRRQFVAPREA